MCRVVSCPACGSVDSRAHHHSLVYYALRCYGSFLSSSLTVSATKLLPLPSSHHPSITNYDYDYYFMLFSFSFPIAVAVIPYWTNLKKKVNSKEKKVLFFCQATPLHLRVSKLDKLHSFIFIFSVPTKLKPSPLPSFIQLFLVVLITVRSRVVQRKYKYSPKLELLRISNQQTIHDP